MICVKILLKAIWWAVLTSRALFLKNQLSLLNVGSVCIALGPFLEHG